MSPWGDDWWQTGVIAATVANAFRAKRKAFKVKDFIPVEYKPIVRQSDEQIMSTLDSFFAARSARAKQVKQDET